MSVEALAVRRLAPFVGEDEARRTVAACARARSLTTLETPAAMLALAECLMNRGGVALLVGRTLRARALGAGAPPSR